jgi:hypothetical protein
MTLAIHRLAGAAAALAVGGTIILGSVFLLAKSYHIPPLTKAKPAPAGNVLYFHTYKSAPVPESKPSPEKKTP